MVTNASEIYVVVLHRPTRQAFTLTRQYRLLHECLDHSEVACLIDSTVDDWEGWKPSFFGQVPAWAKDLPGDTFTAYWIAKQGDV